MLATQEFIETVATLLAPRRLPLVVDPVMVATSGDRLLQAAAHDTLVQKLFPLATIITPNIPETSVLVRLASTLQ
jgi:hydroxymethylpyrimidine/phosphomethylpyrimidine kinase